MFTKAKNKLLRVVPVVAMILALPIGAQEKSEFDASQIEAVVGTPNTLEYVTPNLDGATLINVDPMGFVTLLIKEDLPPVERYSYSLRMNVTPASSSGLFDGTTTEVILAVENNRTQGAGGLSVDISKHIAIGAYGAQIELIEGTFVDIENGGAPIINGSVPANVGLEIGFDADTFIELGTTIPNPVATPVLDNKEIQISWGSVAGATSYDLEWTWVDGYGDTFDGPLRARNSIPFTLRDYELNSTRVQLENTQYTIPLVYSRGYLIYRVRAVGHYLENPERFKYGLWSRGDGNEVTVEDWMPYVYSIEQVSEHQTNKNWQFQASYAEEGKKKEVVSYFDGTLRNRQTVTKINSDDNIIVGEVVYDAQGRPAVEVLPVPISQDTIGYYDNFNLNNAGEVYSYQDFDENSQNILDQFSADKAMLTTEGASKYYSPLNDVSSPFRERVPNAQSYPFSQVEYMPDNTGRIRRKSGVGIDHQLGSTHEMEYYYGTPEQKELNRLFGYSVGHFSRYKKNLVVDPNRQVSVSYIDPQGRTIATALMGSTPVHIDGLPDEDDNSGLHVQTTVDLLGKLNAADPDTEQDNNIRQATQVFGALQNMLAYTATKVSPFDDQRNFSYDLQQTDFLFPCGGTTLNYSVVYDLSIEVTDADGNSLLPDPLDPANFVVNVPRGSFNIAKNLLVNGDALETFADEFVERLRTATDPCYIDPNLLLPFPDAVVDGCFTTCDDCVLALEAEYTDRIDYANQQLAEYDFSELEDVLTPTELQEETDRLRIAFENQWDELILACKAPCTDGTDLTGIGQEDIVANSMSCNIARDLLLTDMGPTGQYGQGPSTLVGDQAIEDTQVVLNIFDETNRIVGAETGLNTGIYNSWRNPRHPDRDPSPVAGSLYTQGHYYNEDGTISYIRVTEIRDENGDIFYEPAIMSGVPLIPATSNSDNNQFLVEPQYLADPSDFTASEIWQDQWAESLLVYHPEYCYLQYAEEICGITATVNGALMNPDGYDQYLRQLTDYTAAGSLATGTAIMNQDPYFNGGVPSGLTGIQFDLRSLLMNEALTSNYSGSGRSLQDFAYATVVCNSISDCPPGGNPASLSATQQDQYWSIYKANYINVKQTINSLFANVYAESNNCYNGCIGEETAPANILAVISDYSSLSSAQRSAINNILDAGQNRVCESEVASLYAAKEKRFKPSDILYDSGQDSADVFDDFSELTGYELYVQTGLCPLARDLEVYLDFAFKDLALTGIPNQWTFTGNYLSRALFEDLGGVLPAASNYVVQHGVGTNSLSIEIVNGELPITLNLPAGSGLSWNNYGGSWVITAVKNMYAPEISDVSQLFTFQVVAQVRTSINAPDYEEVIINGTTQARISNCSIATADFDGIGEYLGDGGSAGPLGDCNKESRFTQALVQLLNALSDNGLLTASGLNLGTVPEYQNSYLNTFFGGSSAFWTNTANTYIIEVDGVQRFVLDLDASLPTTGINGFTGVGLKYLKNGEGRITAQQATVTYLNGNFQKESILGTLSQAGVQAGPLINFLCCPGEDINDLVGEDEVLICQDGETTLGPAFAESMEDLLNALLVQGAFVNVNQLINLSAYPEFDGFLQEFYTKNSAVYCNNRPNDCNDAVDFSNVDEVSAVILYLPNFNISNIQIWFSDIHIVAFQTNNDLRNITGIQEFDFVPGGTFSMTFTDSTGTPNQVDFFEPRQSRGNVPRFSSGFGGDSDLYFGCDLMELYPNVVLQPDPDTLDNTDILVCADAEEDVLEDLLEASFSAALDLDNGLITKAEADAEFANLFFNQFDLNERYRQLLTPEYENDPNLEYDNVFSFYTSTIYKNIPINTEGGFNRIWLVARFSTGSTLNYTIDFEEDFFNVAQITDIKIVRTPPGPGYASGEFATVDYIDNTGVARTAKNVFLRSYRGEKLLNTTNTFRQSGLYMCDILGIDQALQPVFGMLGGGTLL